MVAAAKRMARLMMLMSKFARCVCAHACVLKMHTHWLVIVDGNVIFGANPRF